MRAIRFVLPTVTGWVPPSLLPRRAPTWLALKPMLCAAPTMAGSMFTPASISASTATPSKLLPLDVPGPSSAAQDHFDSDRPPAGRDGNVSGTECRLDDTALGKEKAFAPRTSPEASARGGVRIIRRKPAWPRPLRRRRATSRWLGGCSAEWIARSHVRAPCRQRTGRCRQRS